MEKSFPTRQDIDNTIRERLESEPGFRERLTSDPRGVLSEIVGMPLPDSVAVTLHEETLTDVHIVIPAADSDELSDNDLELVAGGSCWGNWIQVCARPGACQYFLDFNGNGRLDDGEGR
jgi:hypothetical protein